MEEEIEERKLQLLTNITARIFLLTVITSAALALAIWDHSHYQALWNIAYYGSLIVSTSISTIISSASFLLYYALLQFWFRGAFSLYAIQLIAVFISAPLFWIISLRIVLKQRQWIQKSAEQHYKLPM